LISNPDYCENESTVPDGAKVWVHYTGMLSGGTKVFDSSIPRGKPFEFTLGEHKVIQGWETALKYLKKG
jgi:peptidylprolyl isomerase